MAFPGRSAPTTAEMAMARSCECDVFCCTSLAPVYASLSLGLHTDLIGNVSPQTLLSIVQGSDSSNGDPVDDIVGATESIGQLVCRQETYSEVMAAAQFCQEKFGSVVIEKALLLDQDFEIVGSNVSIFMILLGLFC